MKKLTLILTFALYQISFAQNKDTIPGIREVFKKFYLTYSLENFEVEDISFEKRIDGWYIVTKKVIGHYPVDDQKFLFYSFPEKNFKKLSLPPAKKNSGKDVLQYVNEYDLKWFDFYPLYGYNGWYYDVIDSMQRKKKLTDDELYGLARAYSNSAVSLLSNQFGYSVPGVGFKTPLKNDCLSDEQINRYEQIGQKAIKTYEQLKTRNPRYKTYVGDASFNWANETMTHFYNLLVFANEYALKKKLPLNLYSDSVIERSKNILDACPANAIFLSFNDNDFFPLLYTQYSVGLRKDVYVVNYNLISLDRYILRVTQPLFESKPIKLSVDTTMYKGSRNDVLLLKDSSRTIAFKELIDALSNEQNDFPFVRGNRITLDLRSGVLLGVVPSFDLKGVQYLYKNQWVLLDILNNLNERKICSLFQFDDQLKFLNDYFTHKDGLWIFNY